MEEEMANRSAAGNRLIDRRTVLQGAAVLTAAGPALMREGHAAAPPPVVIDAQVHAYAANTPERPWHSVPNWPAHVTGDEMVATMDKVGVNLNLSIPLSQKRGTGPYTRPLILQCSPIEGVRYGKPQYDCNRQACRGQRDQSADLIRESRRNRRLQQRW
jgi:hypothetical protein